MTHAPIFSADSHTMEPPDLWVQRLDRGLRDRAPRVTNDYQGKKGSVFVAEGLTPFPVGGGFAAGKDPKELATNQTVGYEQARPSGWDPAERIKDQDIDGVEKGLRGVMINAASPGDVPYSDPHFDPFWAAAQDLGLPLSLHILTGKKNVQLGKGRVASTMTIIHEVQNSLIDFLYNGVLERFPRLKLVSAENDIGWIAHYLYRLDVCYDTLRYVDPTPITMRPSEYFKRQVYATFQDDRPGVMTYELAGENNLMWASDFPHRASTWPRSRQVIEQNFAGIPAEAKRKITYENVHRLYGI